MDTHTKMVPDAKESAARDGTFPQIKCKAVCFFNVFGKLDSRWTRLDFDHRNHAQKIWRTYL